VTTYLGIDLGTTTFKGAVLDLNRRNVLHMRRIATPPCVPGLPATHSELDPRAVLDTAWQLLNDLLQVAPEATGLVMCGQMHSLVFVDEQLRPVSSIITWQDQRANESALCDDEPLLDRLRQEITAENQREIGGEIRPGVPIATLVALREANSLPNGMYAATFPDLLISIWCRIEPKIEATNAAAHGLFDLNRGDWHYDLIRQLGLDELRWPAIEPFSVQRGTLAINGRELKCFGPVGDQQCALLGAGLDEEDLSLNISTGSQVTQLGRAEHRDDVLVRPYFDNQRIQTIVGVPAGRSLQLLVSLLTELTGDDAPWTSIREAVDRVSDTDLEVGLSFFANRSGRRGRIANIHEGNLSIGHLFLAAFRAMAGNYAACSKLLSPVRKWKEVLFTGSLVRRFPRLRAEILLALGNPPARIAAAEEETMRGLLALALICDKRAASVSEASRLIASGS